MLTTPEGLEIEYAIRLGFNTTNNKAKYKVLIVGLSVAKEAGVACVVAYINSKLVEGQVTGEYKAKEDRMKKCLARVTELMSHFDAVKYQHISKSQNEHVDQLAQLASDNKYVTRNRLPVSHPTRPSTESEPSIHVCTNEPKDD